MKKKIRRKKWHKIIDELPETGCDCVVWGKKLGMHSAFFSEHTNKFYDPCDNEPYSIDLIQMWHDFPSEPKQKYR